MTMSELLSYKTLREENGKQIVIHKSRFIGYGCPCTCEEDALAFISRIRQRHKDATHNCYGYIIGRNAGVMRYSDDREPSGTAGLPIIEGMRARDLVNCAVVVTRYYGGVRLGAGGLVRAYTQSCKLALDAAGIVVVEKSKRYLVEVNYSIWQRLEYFFRSAPCIVLEEQFTDRVLCTLMVRIKDEEQLLLEIARVSDGAAKILNGGTSYYPWPEETLEKT